MQCHTQFTAPSSDWQNASYRMSCEEALEFIRKYKISSPYSYVSDVQLVVERFWGSDKVNFRLLSHSQYNCLLLHSVRDRSLFGKREGIKACLEKTEIVFLNELDALKMGKHDRE